MQAVVTGILARKRGKFKEEVKELSRKLAT
jgi:hypothetical protein